MVLIIAQVPKVKVQLTSAPHGVHHQHLHFGDLCDYEDHVSFVELVLISIINSYLVNYGEPKRQYDTI